MPARDVFHDVAREALEAGGWRITHDPLRLRIPERTLYVDLGAQRLLGASRDDERIAIEVKSFLNLSVIAELEQSLGQYLIYRELLRRSDPGRVLFLAISGETYSGIFSEPIGQLVIEAFRVHILTFNPFSKRIIQWRQAPS